MWLVDGNNVVGSRPDGWWRDRTAAMTRIVELLNALHEQTGDDIVVVFDGRAREAVRQAAGVGISVRFARSRGPGDPADDAIERLVAEADDPGRITVVTSDRDLVSRVSAHGARVTGAGEFREEIDAFGS
jgi:predicted RNA-binding protein with PIN domain